MTIEQQIRIAFGVVVFGLIFISWAMGEESYG